MARRAILRQSVMFTRAGFSMRTRTVCVALIGRYGERGIRPAYLVRFVRSGEYAWANRFGIYWPERVGLCNFGIHLPLIERYRIEATAQPLP